MLYLQSYQGGTRNKTKRWPQYSSGTKTNRPPPDVIPMLTRSPKDPRNLKIIAKIFGRYFPHFGQILGKHHEHFGHFIDTYQKYIDT